MQTANGRVEGGVAAPSAEAAGVAGNGKAGTRFEAPGERSALSILKSIVEDLGMLVRMELRLAQQEILAGLVARGVGAGALAVAGLMALLGVIFLALAATAALDLVMPAWASRIVVALGFLGVAGAAALFGRGRIKAVPMVPEETKRTIKEDVEWAKAQLGR